MGSSDEDRTRRSDTGGEAERGAEGAASRPASRDGGIREGRTARGDENCAELMERVRACMRQSQGDAVRCREHLAALAHCQNEQRQQRWNRRVQDIRDAAARGYMSAADDEGEPQASRRKVRSEEARRDRERVRDVTVIEIDVEKVLRGLKERIDRMQKRQIESCKTLWNDITSPHMRHAVMKFGHRVIARSKEQAHALIAALDPRKDRSSK
mmetsp:Transcript_11504/g.31010  ORF Transcript_11504/g.31010 Transcript_11504/m.31010 type:complete len:212 (-) Transcript_11504:589-1224(-)